MKTGYLPVITPEEGMMLTNGEVYSDKVYIGKLDSVENWREVPMSEYEQWLSAQEERLETTWISSVHKSTDSPDNREEITAEEADAIEAAMAEEEVYNTEKSEDE